MTTITARHAIDLMRSIQTDTSRCTSVPLPPSIITDITRRLFTPSQEVDLHALPYLASRVADSFLDITFSDWFTFHQILLDLVPRHSLSYPVQGSDCILSNFYDSHLSYSNLDFATTELLYQYCKLVFHSVNPTPLFSLGTPGQVKSKARQLLPVTSLAWSQARASIMYTLLCIRSQQDDAFLPALSITSPLLLTHPVSDPFWGSNYSGSNIFCILLSVIRTCHQISIPLPTVPVEAIPLNHWQLYAPVCQLTLLHLFLSRNFKLLKCWTDFQSH